MTRSGRKVWRVEAGGYRAVVVSTVSRPRGEVREGRRRGGSLAPIERRRDSRRRTLKVVRHRVEEIMMKGDATLLTLTMAGEPGDDVCRERFAVWLRRLQRRGVPYVWVEERQKRGVLHYHVLVFGRVPHSVLARTWPYGFVWSSYARKAHKAAAYLNKYLLKDEARWGSNVGYFKGEGHWVEYLAHHPEIEVVWHECVHGAIVMVLQLTERLREFLLSMGRFVKPRDMRFEYAL